MVFSTCLTCTETEILGDGTKHLLSSAYLTTSQTVWIPLAIPGDNFLSGEVLGTASSKHGDTNNRNKRGRCLILPHKPIIGTNDWDLSEHRILPSLLDYIF